MAESSLWTHTDRTHRKVMTQNRGMDVVGGGGGGIPTRSEIGSIPIVGMPVKDAQPRQYLQTLHVQVL